MVLHVAVLGFLFQVLDLRLLDQRRPRRRACPSSISGSLPPFRPIVGRLDRASVVELQRRLIDLRNRWRTPSADGRTAPRLSAPASGNCHASSKKPAQDDFFERLRRVGGRLAADLEDGPVAQAREEQVVERRQLLLVEGVAAVQDDVAARAPADSAGSAPGHGRRRCSAPRRLAIRPASSGSAASAARGSIQRLLPGSPNRMRLQRRTSSSVTVRVVLDRQFAAEVAVPFVGEAPQAGVGPRLHGRVPGFARAADAEERRREGVVDRPLQAGPLARKRRRRARRGTPTCRRAGRSRLAVAATAGCPRRHGDLDPIHAQLRFRALQHGRQDRRSASTFFGSLTTTVPSSAASASSSARA